MAEHDFIARGKEILDEQPKIVVKFGIGMHPTVLEGREHITDDELESLAATLRAAGVEGPLEEPVTIGYKTETDGDSLFHEQDMRDVLCSLIATTETVTGIRDEISPGNFVEVPVFVMDGPTELWTPPNKRLASLALSHPWAAYEQSMRGMPV